MAGDNKSYGIHWFRRDLRVQGNPALEWNRATHSGRTLGLLCIDPEERKREDFSPARHAFWLETTRALQAELAARGGDLWIVEASAGEAFDALLPVLAKRLGTLPHAVSWNRDYEPASLARDAAVLKLLESRHGVDVRTEADHLLIEPREIQKDDDRSPYYQIFTPYLKRWLALLGTDDVAARIRRQLRPAGTFKLAWPKGLPVGSREIPSALAPVELPPAGAQAARVALKRFARAALPKYGKDRDFPALAGTSQLSVHLRVGAITVPQVIGWLGLERFATKRSSSEFKFLSELVWREFYFALLTHFPRVLDGPFNRAYERLDWRGDAGLFEAWKEGRTGYPIVDAGMRQLARSGWMHNRVRMIAATFLVKDLGVDWRLGERYFMQTLLDGDSAPNNGGWQWAASTGADAQPYFRIFNPVLQSRRFDPRGEYIRHWVPELEGVDARSIHEPPLTPGYTRPIVDHSVQKELTLASYRGALAPSRKTHEKYAKHLRTKRKA